MKALYYFDKATGNHSVASHTALLWCPDIRFLEDNKTVEILVAPSRVGTARVSDIKAALCDDSKRVISTDAGYTIIALTPNGEVHERPVIAWNVTTSIYGEGVWADPVPNRPLPLDLIGAFGGEFVAVEEPNGRVFSSYSNWESREKWLKTAKAKLKKRLGS